MKNGEAKIFRKLLLGAAPLLLILFLSGFTLVFIELGNQSNDRLGNSIACVGGSASAPNPKDYIVGAPGFSTNTGEAMLFQGTNGALVNTTFGTTAGDLFGTTLTSVGDVDGDALGDLIVGSPGAVTGQGLAFIYQSGLSGSPLSLSIGQGNENFGASVSGMFSDVNMNGFDDVAVGAPRFDTSFTDVGAVRVFDGNTGSVLQTFIGFTAGAQFGFAISWISDLDSDGLNDLIIGSPFANSNAGMVQVFSTVSVSSPILVTNGTGQTQGLGSAVDPVGDLDGDGKDDFVVGAPLSDVSGTDSGEFQLLSGASGNPLCVIDGSSANERLGGSVRGIGDINLDGLKDFAVGAPGFNGNRGRVYIYTYLPSNTTCSLLWLLDGTLPNEEFGTSLMGFTNGSRICDLNGDGIADIGVGSKDDTNGTDAGAAHILLGPVATPTPTPAPLPASSALTFRLFADGSMSGTNTYNVAPTSSCTFNLYGRHTRSNNTSRGPVIKIATGTTNNQVVTFTASNLPRVKKAADNRPYIWHMIVETTCASTGLGISRFYSNVFARRLTCGKAPAVNVNQWEANFTNRIGAQRVNSLRRFRIRRR